MNQGRSPKQESSWDKIFDLYRRGIDVSLLRKNLSLTVEERFRQAMSLQIFATELRNAKRKL